MEECGMGAAVDQLTARGMEYQSPRWGAIDRISLYSQNGNISIPAMGGNRGRNGLPLRTESINPRDGGAIGFALCTGNGHNSINPRNGGQ